MTGMFLQEYENLAARLKEQYAKERSNFMASLSETEKQELKKEQSDKLKKRAHTKKKRVS